MASRSPFPEELLMLLRTLRPLLCRPPCRMASSSSSSSSSSSAPRKAAASSSSAEAAARAISSRVLFAEDDPTGQVPDGFALVQEGSARVLFPVGDRKEVFYNEVQETNRDLSIACIRTFDAVRKREDRKRIEAREERGDASSSRGGLSQVENLRIFEGLAASGIRSIRYWKEIPDVGSIVVNDLEDAAVESIKRNQELNGITSPDFVPRQGDASMAMYESRAARKTFHVVDLDPYGSAIPFMDAGVQAVTNGGLLCVTCTDASTLCGNNPETCFYKYGSVPLHHEFCHEMAVRIVLHSLAASAGRYQRYIEPQLSLFVDFYIRVFVRVFNKPSIAKENFSKTGMVHQSTQCDSFYVQPLGRVLPGKKEHQKRYSWAQVGGPMWIGPLHNADFVQELMQHLKENGKDFQSTARINAMLNAASQELDNPLYFVLSSMCKKLHLSVPPVHIVRSAILNMGYRTSVTHCNAQGIKTDCPADKLWDILRAYGASIDFKPRGPVAEAIFSKECASEVDLTPRQGDSHRKGGPMFLPNPAENWGPKSRASGRKRAPAGERAAESPAEEEPESKRPHLEASSSL